MSIVSRQLFLWCIAAAAAIASLAMFASAHESPVDHVTRVIGLRIADGRLYLIYRIELGERASLLEMHKIDANGDGSISDEERDAYFKERAQRLGGEFELKLGEHAATLEAHDEVRLDAQFGQTYVFSTPLPALSPGRHGARLIDHFSWRYPGPYTWMAPQPSGERVQIEPTEAPRQDPHDHPDALILSFDLVVRE
jgi:hypothetical protein